MYDSNISTKTSKLEAVASLNNSILFDQSYLQKKLRDFKKLLNSPVKPQ